MLDYENIACPCRIYNGVKLNLPMLKNNNGEADYNVWYHCMISMLQNVTILGSDTDIWVYGMVYKDCGLLGRKIVYVEKTIEAEYVSIITHSCNITPPTETSTLSPADNSNNIHYDRW